MRPRLAILLCMALVLSGCLRTPDPSEGELPSVGDGDPDEVSVLATELDTIWDIRFSTDGRVFVTERPGRILVLDEPGTEPELWATPEVTERGESGLMGLALHPSFPDEPFVYVCHTTRGEDGDLVNQVVRFEEVDGRGGDQEVLVDSIAGARVHDGCTLRFGPDGLLYVTMGDGARASRAQDPGSRNGKVLRLDPDGSPAGGLDDADPYVFTLGHRNPQGLAFHPGTGAPYITEHGPENHDEVNVLEQGSNYGWPEVRGRDDGGSRFTPAIWSSGPQGTVAPSGAAFVQAEGSPLDRAFVFATLKAAQLHVLELAPDDPQQVEDEHVILDGRFGRIRALTWGPDDALYLGTSNEDGRGTPGPQDDRIVRIPIERLEALTGRTTAR